MSAPPFCSMTVLKTKNVAACTTVHLHHCPLSTESFRQLFWRTITKLGQFFKLAVKAESLSVELVVDTLVKYTALEGCSDELKEHFLETTPSSLTCEEFQDIGSSFQEAHGRTQRSGRQSFTSLSSEESSTMNAW